MNDASLRWTIRAGTFALRALASTWRIRIHDRDAFDAVRKDHNVIFTLWHGELLPLLWVHRGEGISIMISEHRDGEIVAQIAESLGNRTIRGSTSRGGSRALIALVRELTSGHDAAITPDGPRGPARVFAPGLAIAAYRSGAYVAPLRASASSAWRLKSWDRFLIPKPFARVDVSYGVPFQVFAGSPREAAEMSPEFERRLASVAGSEP